jgi:hypothetical protein
MSIVSCALIKTSSDGSSVVRVRPFFSAITLTDALSRTSTRVEPREFSIRTWPPGLKANTSVRVEPSCARACGGIIAGENAIKKISVM